MSTTPPPIRSAPPRATFSEVVTLPRVLVALLLLLLLLPFFLTREKPETRTHIRIWVSLDTPDQNLKLQQLLRKFEAENPDLYVTAESLSATRSTEKYLASMQAGTCADILYLHYRIIPMFAGKDALLPLDHYIQRDNFSLSDFYPAALQAHQFNGTQISMPDRGSSMVLFYNKKLFDQHNIPYPTENWTVNDFLAASSALAETNPPGKPVLIPCLPADPVSWIWTLGGAFADDDLKQIHFDDPATISAVKFITDLRQKGLTTPNLNARGRDSTSVDIFERGNVAMSFAGPWSLPTYLKVKDFPWDIAPFPKGPKGRNIRYAGQGYAIWKNSPHPDEAWRVLKYLASPAVMTELRSASLADMSARRSVTQKVFSSFDAPFNTKVLLDSMEPDHVNVMVMPRNSLWPGVESSFYRELDLALMGTKSPQQAMKDAQGQALRFLAITRNTPQAWEYVAVPLILPLVIATLFIVNRKRVKR